MPVYIVAKSITNVDWCWMLIDMLFVMLIDADCWLIMADADWRWLIVLDADWCWLMLIDADWCWLTLIVSDLCWLMLMDANECWLMLTDADWCSNKVQPGFLLSEHTSGASPVIFSSCLQQTDGCKLNCLVQLLVFSSDNRSSIGYNVPQLACLQLTYQKSQHRYKGINSRNST